MAVSIAQSSVFAANAPLEPAKVIYLLRQTKVVKPDRPLNVALSKKQAIVLTERTGKETDEDVKIDAVLIAREIITGFPDDISRVRVTFQNPGTDRAAQIDVTAGDVKAYGSGAMDAKSLLNSLDLNEVDYASTTAGSADSGLTVAAGPLVDKRLLLLSRIEALKSKGTSVKPFMDLFSNIETEAPKASEEQIGKDVSYLAEKLAEQEDLYKESKKPGTIGTSPGSGPISSPTIGPVRPGSHANGAVTSEFQELNRRCNTLQNKFNSLQGRVEGLPKLRSTLKAIRIMIRDPQNMATARSDLDRLESEANNLHY